MSEQVPTVIEIVASYLREHGYDGLYHDSDCGCLLGDMGQCCESFADCRPGYLRDAPPDSEWAGGWIVGPPISGSATACSDCGLSVDGEPCEKINHTRRDVWVCPDWQPHASGGR